MLVRSTPLPSHTLALTRSCSNGLEGSIVCVILDWKAEPGLSGPKLYRILTRGKGIGLLIGLEQSVLNHHVQEHRLLLFLHTEYSDLIS